jgi:hypothetical protein
MKSGFLWNAGNTWLIRISVKDRQDIPTNAIFTLAQITV